MKKLYVIAGPTAVGKTKASIELANRINGEIISADSMQVYKYMDIGSAKIKKEEMKNIKHYVVDELEPSDEFNIKIFKEMADEAMSKIYAKGKIPILVGGTGFYIQAVTRNINFDAPESVETKKSLENRNKITKFYEENGKEALFDWLRKVDSKSCEKIHINNVKRVIRALEYYLETNEAMSEHNEREKQKESPYDLNFSVLNCDRDILYERIDLRVDLMMESGLIEEVKKLKEMGYDKSYVSMQGLGYKEILDYLDENISLEEAIYILKRDTRHFAKRQITWFKREKEANWINVDNINFETDKIVDEILNNN